MDLSGLSLCRCQEKIDEPVDFARLAMFRIRRNVYVNQCPFTDMALYNKRSTQKAHPAFHTSEAESTFSRYRLDRRRLEADTVVLDPKIYLMGAKYERYPYLRSSGVLSNVI